ncbi:hypothetical protein LTR17_010161 [Elasticomyces elasticus]|nr:hypothetical protein LTR17_010161 [Elasticomyces elasticus]
MTSEPLSIAADVLQMNTMATGTTSIASTNNTTATKATSASADTTATKATSASVDTTATKATSASAHTTVPTVDHSITATVAPLESDDEAAVEQTTAPATTRVLGTPELLEAILVGTDAKTLLLSQRVAAYWRDVIRGSISLQKKLFLRPASLEEALHLTKDETGQVVLTRQSLFGAPALVAVLNPLLFTVKQFASQNPAANRGNLVIELKFGALGDQPEAEQPSRSRMQLMSPHQALSMRLWFRNGRANGEFFQDIYHNTLNEPLGDFRQRVNLSFSGSRGYNAVWTNAVMNVFGPQDTLSAQTVAEHLAARENR